MSDKTIVTNSPVGKHLDSIGESKPASYLMFNKKKVELVAKITIGRDTDNDVIVDNKLFHFCLYIFLIFLYQLRLIYQHFLCQFLHQLCQ